MSSNMCAERTPIRHMTSKWKFTGRVPPPPVNLRKTASTAGELCVCCGVSVANNRRFVSKVCHICYHVIFCDAMRDAMRDARRDCEQSFAARKRVDGVKGTPSAEWRQCLLCNRDVSY